MEVVRRRYGIQVDENWQGHLQFISKCFQNFSSHYQISCLAHFPHHQIHHSFIQKTLAGSSYVQGALLGHSDASVELISW